ncbi:MAG: hypothetical protein KKG59_05185 [Nanoarchaeota archaeon]|nr:hypothetical protein [Nanoarchaeota archaeon]
MGSVKDLEIEMLAFENLVGSGLFHFSDRYSIFDWGEMPNLILGKGAALAVMAAWNFEQLERMGISTHYRGLQLKVDTNVKLLRFEDLKLAGPSNVMAVELSVVYHPMARRYADLQAETPGTVDHVDYDYSFFEQNRGQINNYVVPLEIIFRNGLPLGSSVFKRIAEAKAHTVASTRQAKLQNIYAKLGVTSEPKPGDMLPKPILEYTTKFEEGDRHLSEDEAYQVSGLTEEQFAQVEPLALKVNDMITARAEETGLSPHWDGKVEMRFLNRKLGLVDVLGTLDEDRFGTMVSKEFLRQWYKQNQPEFSKACAEWKQKGSGWQEQCPVKPQSIPLELQGLVSQMYMAATNQYVKRRIFDVPELGAVMDRLQAYGE